MIEFRAHHLLCMQFFEGKGYSAAFVANTGAVLARLEQERTLRIVKGADSLCAACPALEQGCCLSREKTERYDEKAFRLLSLQPGETLDFPRFSEELRASGRLPALLDEICPDCEWRGICRGKAATL